MAVKRSRKAGEIFSMSFLDVICCGFGAMVLLVLLSKTDVVELPDVEMLQNLLRTITAQQQTQTAAERERERLRGQLRRLESDLGEIDEPGPDLSAIERRLAESRAQAKILQIQVEALAQQTATGQGVTDEVAKVGGIPVDSRHVIFIVDTSGSMQTLWPRVIAELENVLTIHPEVKGFQIMDDMGNYLIKSYAGKWIPDTPGRRKSVLSRMKRWRSFSNSSPVEGLQRALKTYARRTEKLAIYIFGDDYTGSSYDPVLNTISELNLDRETGRPIARIHAIGFQQVDHVGDRFATLMREVARRNRGAFVALGLKRRADIVEGEHRNRN